MIRIVLDLSHDNIPYNFIFIIDKMRKRTYHIVKERLLGTKRKDYLTR